MYENSLPHEYSYFKFVTYALTNKSIATV